MKVCIIKPRVDKDLLRQYHEGIICLSSCIAGEIPQAIIRDNMERTEKLVQEYVDIFGKDNFFLEIPKIIKFLKKLRQTKD